MRGVSAALLCGLVIASPVQAEMSVSTFVGKADALKRKGFMAIGSPDIKLLQNEMQGVTTAYRADIKGARAADRTPHSCPPETPQRMSSDELLAHFRTIPAAQAQKTSIKTAFYGMMKKRYPCPAG